MQELIVLYLAMYWLHFFYLRVHFVSKKRHETAQYLLILTSVCQNKCPNFINILAQYLARSSSLSTSHMIGLSSSKSFAPSLYQLKRTVSTSCTLSLSLSASLNIADNCTAKTTADLQTISQKMQTCIWDKQLQDACKRQLQGHYRALIYGIPDTFRLGLL